MNYLEAIEQMKQGQICRRSSVADYPEQPRWLYGWFRGSLMRGEFEGDWVAISEVEVCDTMGADWVVWEESNKPA